MKAFGCLRGLGPMLLLIACTCTLPTPRGLREGRGLLGSCLPGAEPAAAGRVVSEQPDLLIRSQGEADSAYQADGVYQTAPRADQTEGQTVSAGSAAVYDVLLQNDGTEAHAFVLKTTESTQKGWTITYMVGGTEISDRIRSTGGFATPTLSAAGGSFAMRITMSPDGSVAAGTRKSAIINVFLDGLDSTVRDSVAALSTAGGADTQPDLLVKNLADLSSAFSADNVYETVPQADQTRQQEVLPDRTAFYSVMVQNDGNRDRSFRVKAEETAQQGWRVSYHAGSTDITSAVTHEGFETPVLTARTGRTVITVSMTPTPAVPGGTRKGVSIRVYLDDQDAVVRDVVAALTTAGTVVQPDLLVKNLADLSSAFSGDNVYETVPQADQTRQQEVLPDRTAFYSVMVQNDGNRDRSFRVKAEETAQQGWRVSYHAGSTDITSAVTHEGFETPVLTARTGRTVITVSMTPTPAVPGGTRKGVSITAFRDAADTTVRDAVFPVTVAAPLVRPDLLIKSASDPDAAYALDGIYQAAPTGAQIRRQTVTAGAPALYRVRLQNAGNVARTFLLKAAESAGTGWVVTYKAGATDITNAVKGAGRTSTTLLPGGYMEVVVSVTPSAPTPGGSSKSVTLQVKMDAAAATVLDAVQAVATVATVAKPDLLAKPATAPDSSYVGDGLYQATPTATQTIRQTVNAGATARYRLRVQNDGNTARTFLIKAVESSQTGWTVAYNVGATGVATQIKGAGYTTATLVPGGITEIQVNVIAGAGVAVGSSQTATLKVFLDAADTTPRDAVQVVTMAGAPGKPDLMIKKSTVSTYAGDGLYQVTPSGVQACSGPVFRKGGLVGAITYHVKVQNDSPAAHSYVVRAIEGSTQGWTVTYRTGSTDITARVKGSGYTTPSLAAGGYTTIIVTLLPGAGAASGSAKAITLRALNDSADTTVRDAVSALTTLFDL